MIERQVDGCGLVVQLVRTLACHARGRGFESHPGRHLIYEHAAMAQEVERILGKDEVTSSTLVSSSKKLLFKGTRVFLLYSPATSYIASP